MQRFWNKVDKTENCWNWMGALRGGYGCIKYQGKVYDTHRFVWFLTYGSMPIKWVLHRCDNRKCVRPDHLFAGDALLNVRDAINKGRFHPWIAAAASPNKRKTKIPKEIIKQIQRDYSITQHKTTMLKLSRKYALSETTIHKIIHYKYN